MSEQETSEQETRREAIKEWTCPHHDEPRRIAGQGYEAEDIAIDSEFPATIALMRWASSFSPTMREDERFGDAWIEMGLCCEGAEWRVVGYRTVVVSPWERMLRSDPILASLRRTLSGPHVLLDELAKLDTDGQQT
jgi:hypothetical protein